MQMQVSIHFILTAIKLSYREAISCVYARTLLFTHLVYIRTYVLQE